MGAKLFFNRIQAGFRQVSGRFQGVLVLLPNQTGREQLLNQ
jgi:hypothetical protein